MPVPADVPFTTEDGTDAARSVGLLEVKPNDRFLFVHYPENWEVGRIGDATWWLPQLHHLPLQPGVNNVATPKKDEPLERSYADAIALQKRRKVTVIPLDVTVSVEQADGSIEHVHKYLRRKACREPRTGRQGFYYLTPFETPRTKRPNRRQKFEFHQEPYNRWRLGLVRDGIVAPPVAGLVNEKIGRAKYHELRQADKAAQLQPAVVERLTDEAAKKAAEVKDAKVPGPATATAPANAWDGKTAKELAAIIKAGGADLVLDAIKATDTRRDVLAAIKARKRTLEPAPADDASGSAE